MITASRIPGIAILSALVLAGCDNSPTAPPEATNTRAQLTTSEVYPLVGQRVNIVLISTDAKLQCMDVVAGVAYVGASVQAYPCWNGPNQQFTIDSAPMSTWVKVGTLYRLVRLRNRADLVIFRSVQNPNLCLDVTAATANGGEMLQLYTCHYGSNQAFRLPAPPPSPPTYGGIDTEVSGFHMRLEAGSGNDPYVRQKPSDSLARQRWGYQPVGTGFRL